jgi:hypothetical protein
LTPSRIFKITTESAYIRLPHYDSFALRERSDTIQ